MTTALASVDRKTRKTAIKHMAKNVWGMPFKKWSRGARDIEVWSDATTIFMQQVNLDNSYGNHEYFGEVISIPR